MRLAKNETHNCLCNFMKTGTLKSPQSLYGDISGKSYSG